MRPARLTLDRGDRLAPVPPLLAVAHGSRDPRAAATISALMTLVRERAAKRARDCPAPPLAGSRATATLAGLPGFTVRAAFLGHCAPSVAEVLSGLAASAVPARDRAGDSAAPGVMEVAIVPLLLTAAYHASTDIPAQLAAASAALPGLRARQAAALGPHPLLLAAAQRRLAQATPPGLPRDRTSVVLAAAGSSDPRANAQVAALAARWQDAGGWRRVVPAFASAASPAPADAVRALREQYRDGQVVVATYLLAPGHFADKVREQASEAGAVAVSAPLSAAPEVADVIIDRYLEALRGPVRWPGPAGSDGTPGLVAACSARTPLRKSVSWALRITRTRRGSRGRDDVNTLTRER
jgi:sirohydrochlorin ferrochelatase